ncbi:MAG TPA: antitoxin [Thermodesulfovibrionia bacterium]|nr:antitoxin [Thermodesulfovibrionia bacterium]
MKKTKLDELDELEKEIESNADKFRKISKDKEDKIKRIILKANEKNKVTLMLNNQDLERLKNKAKEEGLPYQTLISNILHNYVTDKANTQPV